MKNRNGVSPLLLGAHLSIARGIDHALYEAAELGCRAVQLFTKNASTWREKEITESQAAEFARARKETGITRVFSHCAYLINIAGNNAEKTTLSVQALYHEILRCGHLQIPYVVLHPGSHMGDGEEAGINRVAGNLDSIMDRFEHPPDTMILLETTAGQGSSIGHTFDQLAAIRESARHKDRIGFCLDTCHVFAAGYDLSTDSGYLRTMEAFEAAIGLSHLRLIHLNDAKKTCGSRVDRHEHIGEGHIGESGFGRIVNDPRLSNIPMIIETPKEKDGGNADPANLARLHALYKYRKPEPRAETIQTKP